MHPFSQLKKKLKNDFSHLEPVRIALLGDTATQFLAQAIRATGFDHGFDLQIWEAGFDQIERQVFDAGSELYTFAPQVIILFHSSHKLLSRYNKLAPAERGDLADHRLSLIDQLMTTIGQRLPAKVIYYNYPEIDDAVFGNYANKTISSFLFQLRKLNIRLMEWAAAHPGFHLCELSTIQNVLGKTAMFHAPLYINTDMVLGIDALPPIANRTVALIGALYGRIKKCLILDLDNTLWGGVIGDDGPQRIEIGSLGIGKAFTELQYWVKKLGSRGIVLAVCSKNQEAVARLPFEQHPDMVLSLDDIAVFQANWDNKVENIRQIGSRLNIGFDSMVFLDDNPFEREMVREGIPGITVPDLPEDPADWLEYLYRLDLFETASWSKEDAERVRSYQTEALRETERQKFDNEDAFLKGLNMVSRVEPFNTFNSPRVAQLSQRSNQFNLRTVRYEEADILRMAGSPEVFPFSFTLEDRLGEHGIIAVVILKKLSGDTVFIDTWLMSCRVLKRGMENFTLNTIAGFAKEKGFRYLKGEYLPTPKNDLVKRHFEDLGFSRQDDGWILDTSSFEPLETHIDHGEGKNTGGAESPF